jgi:hypothetical protein
MPRKHDESKLPKWAQKKLAEQRQEIKLLQSLKEAHAVLDKREWFTIPGPPADKRGRSSYSGDNVYNLWTLSNSGAHPVCSLYVADILLVGRAESHWDKKEGQHENTDG